MSTSQAASQLPFPPVWNLLSSHQHTHPPPRIFIGPLSSVPSSSSSHGRTPSSETEEPRQRKRDVVRRRRKKANSVGEWGEASLVKSGVRGFIGRKVAGAGAGAGESEERLVRVQTAEDAEEDDVGLGWFRIKWEGETSANGRSDSGGSSSKKGGKAGAELNTSNEDGQSSPPPANKFFSDLPKGLTSSPITTPNLSKASTLSLNLAPGPSRDRSQSHPSSSSPSAALHPSSLRPLPITQASTTTMSSAVGSFVTAQSFVSCVTTLPAPLDSHTSSLNHASAKTVTPPPPAHSDLPTFHHTPASPEASLHPASLPSRKKGETALLRSAFRRLQAEPRSQTVHFPITPAISQAGSVITRKGKGKQGLLAEEIDQSEEVLEGDAEPADPSVVLKRSEAPEPGEAGQKDGDEDDTRDLSVRDVILRDRMLVKVQYSRSAGLPPEYDEWAQRTVPADRSERWEEKLVVLRKGVVEIWEDWNLPLREKFTGRKKLAHVIPLDRKTALSLYSHTDLTFCLATPPTSVSSSASSSSKPARLKVNRTGTSIFLFNPKTRTRSTDWMWEIYLLLRTSDALPSFLDVHVPDLNNARIRIPVPVVGQTRGVDSTEAVVRAVTRAGVIQRCVEVLKDLEGWKRLMTEMGVEEGGEGEWDEVKGKVGLAWRKRDRLDWVWADRDVNGNEREWNLLVGAGPLTQMRLPSVLELRLARHNNAVVHVKGGGRALEPPGVEGYLTRIKPKTGARTTIYITSHDGNLFVCSSNKSHPPSPPSAVITPSSPISPKSKPSASSKAPPPLPSTFDEFKFSERCRAVLQILGSSGLVDLRQIVDVRRVARTPRPSAPAESHDPTNGNGSGSPSSPGEEDEGWESLDEDEEDEGGEEGLKKGKTRGETTDVSELRRKRMFEIELSNGDVQAFELGDLRAFWAAKHETVATQEMEVSHVKHIHTSDIVSGRKQQDEDPHAKSDDEVVDPDEPPPYLEEMWNFCVIEGCRSITKAGRVFTKRGNRQYRSKYTILVSGHLLQFSLKVDKPFHLRSHRISLIDAYVYTGLLAQDELPPSSNENALKHESRLYSDGLQTSDGAEDTCLVLWYRPHTVTSNAAKLHHRAASDDTFTPPPLGRKGHEQMVLRARSKLERDSWVWAIGLEIERITRMRQVREERLRNAGGIRGAT